MFYEFNQNNSGGGFDYDERAGISHFVIIEADSADEANRKAEDIGIYFDDDYSIDCPCCGTRWSPAYGEGDPEPLIYGRPAEEFGAGEWDMLWMDGYEAFVHYADGRVGMIAKGRERRDSGAIVKGGN